jgi:hypothetical protein
MPLSPDELGLGDADGATFSLAGLGLDSGTAATDRFNASIVAPDDDADRTPRAVLAYITRVLDIVDPIRTPTRPLGAATTHLAPRTTPVTKITRTAPTHGSAADVLHFIDTVLHIFDPVVATRATSGFGPGRGAARLAGYRDQLVDREITALRRALELRADAPTQPAGHDLLPDSLEFVVADRDDDRADREQRLLHTHRVLHSADTPNGVLARVTYDTGPTTRRVWSHTVKAHALRLVELGLTPTEILARLNDDD